LTKFCHLRPLKGKDAAGAARELYQILKLLWPCIQIVHGRSRKPSTQGSVERSNGDFQNILEKEQEKEIYSK